MVFDDTGSQLAFLVRDTVDNQLVTAIRYVQLCRQATEELIGDHSSQLGKDITIDRIDYFSHDGSRLLFHVAPPPLPPKKTGMAGVDVWSYADPIVQGEQLAQLGPPPTCLWSVDVRNTRRLIQLQQPDEDLWVAQDNGGDRVVTTVADGDPSEYFWSKKARRGYRLCDLRTGTKDSIHGVFGFISPGGRYLGYYSYENFAQIFMYDAEAAASRCVTRSIPVPLADPKNDQPNFKGMRILGQAGWYPGDTALLLYDRYDIWRVDPQARKAPVCITHGYGRRHHTIFRLAAYDWDGPIPDVNHLLLTALDERTKDNGFYELQSEDSDPRMLLKGPFAWYVPDRGIGMVVKKARQAQGYLLFRQSAEHAPDLYFTTDFKTLRQLSDIHPEQQYNWLTSTLFSFRTTAGRTQQGILYKPENFDPAQKYPVIIHYYERRSNELHKFNCDGPDNGGEINIPWFVSHGYLVCVVDIDYTIGWPGPSVLQSVEGAAAWLRSLGYVDARHLGLQGHSWGGFETNYIVTHSHLFAAACSSSGPSDLVSDYLDFLGMDPNFDIVENRQFRMAVPLWERPAQYIENSPVFYLPRVTTPMLTVSNHLDGNVAFNQGVELFEGMRRLGKPCWMLQYDHGGHGVDGNDQMDYLLRMTQFFDYYLKGARCPKWMAQGVPAIRKGFDDGLALEPPGVGPKPGILSAKEQQRVKQLLTAAPRIIVIQP